MMTRHCQKSVPQNQPMRREDRGHVTDIYDRGSHMTQKINHVTIKPQTEVVCHVTQISGKTTGHMIEWVM